MEPLGLQAGEQDVGADDDPKGVLANDGDVDKDANDPKDCYYERGHKSKTHLCPQLVDAWPACVALRRSM